METYIITYTPYNNGCQLAVGSGESIMIEVQSMSDPDFYDYDELSYDDVWMEM